MGTVRRLVQRRKDLINALTAHHMDRDFGGLDNRFHCSRIRRVTFDLNGIVHIIVGECEAV